MSQFPLALAIEPKLLPCAISNGFSMDYKVVSHLLFSHTNTFTYVSILFSIAISFFGKCLRSQLSQVRFVLRISRTTSGSFVNSILRALHYFHRDSTSLNLQI